MREFNRFNDELKKESKSLKKIIEKNAVDTDFEEIKKKDKPTFGDILGAVARARKPEK